MLMFTCRMSLQGAAGLGGMRAEVDALFIFSKSARTGLSNCTRGRQAAVSMMTGRS